MKIFYPAVRKTITFITLFFCVVSGAIAQPLAAGDIAFAGYISQNTTPDEFSFIALRNIPGSSVIFFTDNGWNTAVGPAALGNTEVTITWTAPAGGITAGTEVRIAGTGNTSAPFVSTNVGSVTAINGTGGTPFALANSGDQVLAYTGSAASPTFIGGIHMNVEAAGGGTTAAGWDPVAGIGYSSNRSALPPGLTSTSATAGPNPTATAMWFSTEQDNAVFLCGSNNITTIPNLRSAIFNTTTTTHWSVNNSATAGFVLPTGCTYNTLATGGITLSGRNKLSHVLIEWTATDAATTFVYDIERAYNGRNFTSLNTITGNGSRNYSYTDADAMSSGQATAFYRIKSTDRLSGKVQYSDVVKVQLGGKQSLVVDLLSNPVKQALSFNLLSNKVQDADIIVTDVNGRVLARRSQQLAANTDTRIDLGNGVLLQPGVYFLTVITTEQRQTIKLVKE